MEARVAAGFEPSAWLGPPLPHLRTPRPHPQGRQVPPFHLPELAPDCGVSVEIEIGLLTLRPASLLSPQSRCFSAGSVEASGAYLAAPLKSAALQAGVTNVKVRY